MPRIVGGKSMLFLRIPIVAFIVTGIMDLLAKKSRKKTGALKKFVVRAPLDFSNDNSHWCLGFCSSRKSGHPITNYGDFYISCNNSGFFTHGSSYKRGMGYHCRW